MKRIDKLILEFAFAGLCFLIAGNAQAGDIKGKVIAPERRSTENIAVYVEAIPDKTFPPPAEPVLMDQKKMVFAPHVLVVLKGTTVDFLNSDLAPHNVLWPSIGGDKKLRRNLGVWSQGQKKSFTFSDLGTVPLLCNVHPEMFGYVVVVPTPYFAVTGPDHQFVIKDVPPGQYILKTWSEEGKPATQQIDVGAGEVEVQLTVRK